MDHLWIIYGFQQKTKYEYMQMNGSLPLAQKNFNYTIIWVKKTDYLLHCAKKELCNRRLEVRQFSSSSNCTFLLLKHTANSAMKVSK